VLGVVGADYAAGGVDVRDVREGEAEGGLLGDCEGKGICILTASMRKGDRDHGKWKNKNIQRCRKIN